MKKKQRPFKTKKKKSVHGLGRKGPALFLNQFHQFAFLLTWHESSSEDGGIQEHRGLGVLYLIIAVLQGTMKLSSHLLIYTPKWAQIKK